MALLEHYGYAAIFSFDAIYRKNGFRLAEEFLGG
jgi:hypothetical protein